MQWEWLHELSDLNMIVFAGNTVGVRKDMEEKRPSRLVGSKVSQIANIFQSMAPAKDAEVLLTNNSIPLRNHQPVSPKPERRRTVAGDDLGSQRESPTVTVVRTESHVARFNTARALFEKLGSEDNKSARADKLATPLSGSRLTASNQNLHSRSSSDNSSAGTSPVRSSRPISSRSPSPRECLHAERSTVVSSNGCLAITDGGLKKKDLNGLDTNGLCNTTDEESMSTTVKIPSSSYLVERQKQVQPTRQVEGHKTNGVVKFGKDVILSENKMVQLNAGTDKISEKPEKPEKPERKFNSRELIEKQRNWTSHFSKSRASRYNSDPNKSEVSVGLSASAGGGKKETEKVVGVEGNAASATRSASFSAVRTVRSPAVSPPPPPPQPQPTVLSPVNMSEEKLERESMEKTCRFPASPTQSSASPSPSSEDKDFQPVALQGRIRNDSSSLTSPGRSEGSFNSLPVGSDCEKRLREEDSEEVKCDVAHIDKRTKMVSSVQLTLQASRPVSAASSGDEAPSEVSVSPESDGRPPEECVMQPVITNSVLRELESDGTELATLLPAEKYTEILSSPCSDGIEEAEVAPGLGRFHLRPDRSETCMEKDSVSVALTKSDFHEGGSIQGKANNRSFEYNKGRLQTAGRVDTQIVTTFIEGERCHTSRSSAHPALLRMNELDGVVMSEVDEIKSPADNIGGSVHATSPLEAINDRHIFSKAAVCMDNSEEGASHSLTQDWESTSSRELSAQDCMKTSSSVASILDLQDVEYADADAEDGDDEAERDDYVCREVEKQPCQVVDGASFESAAVNEATIEPGGSETVSLTLAVDVPETMTPDEAEHLLSSRILEKKIRQESLLSDEEAQEVTRLLSPTDDKEHEDPDWLADVLSCTSDSLLQESTLDYRSRSELSVTMEDSMISSSHVGSQSGSESGLLGSVSSLNEADQDQDYRQEDVVPQPGRVIIVENGVHYFEDGHFWMEVPGLPESEDDEDLDYPVSVKKSSKVTFSTGPIKVYSTFSVTDYDRRNEDVDPVAASAEYELEKRVEKMEVFPVELTKGPEGLGLSIIGMGVGADAGLEKLGIFVKTITDQGAAARDGRIQVNDQIIEVDCKSLVGVTQAYAASVLRNTCGLVKFLIGRERDPDNSEVAQLIKQSLQADREREEQRRQMELQQQGSALRGSKGQLQDPGATSPDSSMTLPLTGTSPTTTSSSSDGPASPPDANNSVFEQDGLLSPIAGDVDSIRALIQETQLKDAEISRLKGQLADLEHSGADQEEMLDKLRQASAKLREVERSLLSARKDVTTYQDMLEQSQGQYIVLEKKYGKAKKLLREFQQREQDMIHREEFHLQLLQEKDTEYNALVKTLKDRVIQLEQELLETQRKAGFPTVLPYDNTSLRQLTPQLSRRHQPPPVKPLLQQLETELSDTEISDISPEDGDKTATVERKMPVKEELDRAVPPHELLDVSASKAKAELATRGGLAGRQLPSAKKGSGGLSSSSSDYGLDDSCDNSGDEEPDKRHLYIEYVGREDLGTTPEVARVPNPTTRASSHVHNLVSQFSSAKPMAGLYAPATHVPGPRPLHLHPHHHQPGPPPRLAGPPPSLAEQLKQVLAERERRISGGDHATSREDFTEMSKGVSQQLVEEIRQAVNEANARVKKVSPQTLLPPTTQTPWQPQTSPLRDVGPPSPSVSSSGSISSGITTADPSPNRPLPADGGDVWAPPHPQDVSSGFSAEKKMSHYWQSAPVNDWSVEQVCQWLLALGLEQLTPKFRDQQVGGASLLQLESRDLKLLGICGDDKSRLKRKLKELKVQVEKEKRQLEKERKEKERLQKKAEKLAEKASKRK